PSSAASGNACSRRTFRVAALAIRQSYRRLPLDTRPPRPAISTNSVDKLKRSGVRMKKISLTLLGGLIAAAVLATVTSASPRDVTLNLVVYSTPREAYKTIIPAFQKTPAGKGVNFTQSYGPSG